MIVYEVRYNYPYEGYSCEGIYTDEDTAIEAAKSLIGARNMYSDWIDVTPIELNKKHEWAEERAIWMYDRGKEIDKR